MSRFVSGDKIRATGPHGTAVEGFVRSSTVPDKSLRLELHWMSPRLSHLESSGYSIEKIETDQLAAAKAEAWDEAAEAITDWSLNMVSHPSGSPIDPPTNPYRAVPTEGVAK